MAKAIAKKQVSKNEYETALVAFVNLETRIDTLVLGRDKALQPILEKYDPQIKELQVLQETQAGIIQEYVELNKKTVFIDGAKSMEHMGAHVGFRSGADKVMIMEGYEEKAIVAGIVANKDTAKGKKWYEYLRQAFTLDKVKLKKEMPKGMEKLGITVGSEETFFVEAVK